MNELGQQGVDDWIERAVAQSEKEEQGSDSPLTKLVNGVVRCDSSFVSSS